MIPKSNLQYFESLKKLASEKSYSNYVTRLNTIINLQGIKGESLHNVLVNPSKYYPIIKDQYTNINTRKNMVVAVVSVFKHDKTLQESYASEYASWVQQMKDLGSYLDEQSKHKTPSKKQTENYVSFDEIKLKFHELQKDDDPHSSFNKSLAYVLLAIVLDITPKRCDLGNMKIYHNEDPNNNNENYIVLKSKSDNGSSYLVLNNYKTSKVYKRYEEDLSWKFINIMKQSLRRYPRKHLFVNTERQPYVDNDHYGKFFQRTFLKLFGKATGTSLLRHIYIIENIDFSKTEGELESIAKTMLHSFSQQSKYKFVRNSLQTCICKPKANN